MSIPVVSIAPHPLLQPLLFTIELPAALGTITSPDWLVSLLQPGSDAPLQAGDDIRAAVRDLLRWGGYKPTGRGKPASEYLLKASTEGRLGSINAAVDLCNVVSLASGLPISLVDLDRAREPLSIAVAPEGTSYLFNASGQEMDLGGLLALFDAEGACANGVKDAQRTKTSDDTRRTLTVIWGSREIAEQVLAAERWYRLLAGRLGWTVGEVRTVPLES